ncbi:hypothetical protein BDF14DRAFT_214850 [Spinellus fusiger]|nr:hypothetical protein BDF14DRAFT_214850 [Spinellus fusiger]
MTTAREDTVTHASISTNTSTRTETPQIHRKHLRSHSLSVPDTTLINTVPLQPRNTQTQTSFHMSKEPPLKRRRGRPLSTGNSTWEGGWVFMTPTVWSVVAPLQPVTASSLLPSYGLEAQGDMATAFTNATMDTILYMPKKKRGRKPKTQMAGNSCFDNPILGTEQLLKYNTLSKVGD